MISNGPQTDLNIFYGVDAPRADAKPCLTKNTRDAAMTQYKNLNDLSIQRPVIKHALLHSLHDVSDEVRMRQNVVLDQVREILENKTEKIYHIHDKKIIILSICRTLEWISDHPSHEWKMPLIRLMRVLAGEKDVLPEPNSIPDPKSFTTKKGYYAIQYGCRKIENNMTCDGTMVSTWNQIKDPTTNRGIMYTCNKCNYIKLVK